MTDDLGFRVEGDVAWITIQRPQVRNALNLATIRALEDALGEAERRARVIVLTGAGERVFCAGADLGAMAADPEGRAEAVRAYARLLQRLLGAERPVIARVNGHCLAGGMGLLLACDLAVASESATFFLPEATVGLWPMMVGALLLRDLPRKVALELALTGCQLSAGEALGEGLVNRVVPAGELDAAVATLAARVTAMGPAALRLGRRAWTERAPLPTGEAIGLLAEDLLAVMATEDAVEGTVAFLQKRQPQWSDR